MGVYKAAVVPIVIMFLLVGLVGHHTGRLREVPVVGVYWDDATVHLIDLFYSATGIYINAIGKVGRQMPVVISEYTYDPDLTCALNKSSYVYPYWSYTSFPREKLPEILKSEPVQEFVSSVIEEAMMRVDKEKVPSDQYLLYLRGTAYEVMVEKAKYCAGGPTKDPRYVVTRCGDCDDWHVVAYAIISSINEDHGVEARYFLTMVPSHAFLTAYYPAEDKWELYDWFPPIGLLPLETGKFEEVVLNGWECYTVSNVSSAGCVVKIRQFEDFEEMSTFYGLTGYFGARVVYSLPGPSFEYLFELPSLKYASPDYIHCLENGHGCAILLKYLEQE